MYLWAQSKAGSMRASGIKVKWVAKESANGLMGLFTQALGRNVSKMALVLWTTQMALSFKAILLMIFLMGLVKSNSQMDLSMLANLAKAYFMDRGNSDGLMALNMKARGAIMKWKALALRNWGMAWLRYMAYLITTWWMGRATRNGSVLCRSL